MKKYKRALVIGRSKFDVYTYWNIISNATNCVLSKNFRRVQGQRCHAPALTTLMRDDWFNFDGAIFTCHSPAWNCDYVCSIEAGEREAITYRDRDGSCKFIFGAWGSEIFQNQRYVDLFPDTDDLIWDLFWKNTKIHKKDDGSMKIERSGEYKWHPSNDSGLFAIQKASELAEEVFVVGIDRVAINNISHPFEEKFKNCWNDGLDFEYIKQNIRDFEHLIRSRIENYQEGLINSQTKVFEYDDIRFNLHDNIIKDSFIKYVEPPSHTQTVKRSQSRRLDNPLKNEMRINGFKASESQTFKNTIEYFGHINNCKIYKCYDFGLIDIPVKDPAPYIK